MKLEKVYAIKFAGVYPYYVKKVESKGRTKEELNKVIRWLTGYTPKQFETQLKGDASLKTFFANAPRKNPARKLITGTICGVRVEEIKEPLMREIRYMDKLIDELAKGKTMDKILRKN